jgi:hypothetical protein
MFLPQMHSMNAFRIGFYTKYRVIQKTWILSKSVSNKVPHQHQYAPHYTATLMLSIFWNFKIARISATRGHLCLSWQLQSAVLSKSPCIILCILLGFLHGTRYTDMRRLTTAILFEKCVVRRFRRCENVIQCTYTNLRVDSIAHYTPTLYGIAYCS